MPYRLLGSGLGVKNIPLSDFDAWLDKQIDAKLSGGSNEGYNAVAWAYRCVQLRANAIASMPFRIVRAGGEQEIEPDEFPFSFRRLFWRTEAALCLSGANWLLKQANRVRLMGLQWLNPQTMTVEVDEQRGITGHTQKIGANKKTFPPDRIVYTNLFNPDDDLGPGISPAGVAKVESALAIALNTWANRFFEEGAIPGVILWSEQQILPAELDRIETVWKSLFKGVKRAWATIALQKGLKPEVISPPVKDLAVPELSQLVREQIAVAFGVPQTLLEDAANYATAKEHKQSFVTDTIVPECELISESWNEQLFTPMGYKLEFLPEETDIMQVDESERADSLAQLRNAGMPLKVALEVLGYELTVEQWAELKADEERKQREAEERFNRPQPVAMPAGGNGRERAPARTKAAEQELYAWRRWATKRIADGPIADDFRVNGEIPQKDADGIKAALAVAQDRADVEAAFEPYLEIKARFVPNDADEPLTPIPAQVVIDEDETDWDRLMPEFSGLLDATVIHSRQAADAA